jgi:hypothetical protein
MNNMLFNTSRELGASVLAWPTLRHLRLLICQHRILGGSNLQEHGAGQQYLSTSRIMVVERQCEVETRGNYSYSCRVTHDAQKLTSMSF